MVVKKREKVNVIFQIVNLIFSIIAISFIIGIFNIEFVSGFDEIPQEWYDYWGQDGGGGGSVGEDVWDLWASGYTGEGGDFASGGGTPTNKFVDWFSKDAGFGSASATFAGHIVEGFLWSGIAMGAFQLMGALGLDENTVGALTKSAFAGIMSGKALYGTITEGGIGENFFSDLASGDNIFSKAFEKMGAKGTSIFVGAGISIAVFLATYKKTSQEERTFECDVWDAPAGGNDCEKCNQQGDLPCSEYQCRSLGQSCQLLNKGTGKEQCAWVNKNDVNPPIITPWEEALTPDFKYTPDNAISPPDRGVKITNQESTTGCVKAFTPLSFGVTLDEPAKCKLDYIRKQNFSDMQFHFGGSVLSKYNHTQIMSLPGPSALKAENITIENDGEFEIYTRCQDSNGNSNTANFLFKFCVEKGPDTTPPLIVTTNLLNNMPISYNQTEIENFEVYTNEPANCKWSHLDQSYDNMEETMSCSSSVLDMNAQMLYKCSSTLTGLKNRQDNKFYIRCKDQPTKTEDRNENKESYEFTLIGTQPLVIDSVLPNETIKDSTDSVKVTLEAKTSAGYDEGNSTCYYSETEDDYVMFFDTNSYKHSQELWLTGGSYNYFIKCVDLGGNADTKKVNFDVETDRASPIVARVYHEETYLKLVTTEEAKCVYDTKNCNYLFDEGVSFKVIDKINHFVDWDTKKKLYIKCKDEYDNQPSPSQCSIVAKAFKE